MHRICLGGNWETKSGKRKDEGKLGKEGIVPERLKKPIVSQN